MPTTIIPLQGVDRSELDELVRGLLVKRGITAEPNVNSMVEQAEKDYEQRLLVRDVNSELTRLMAERAKGNKLMQRGYRKWKVASFRQVKGKGE